VTALVGAVARGKVEDAPPGSVPVGGPAARFTAPTTGPVSFTGNLDRTAVLVGRDGQVRMELVIGGADDGHRARRVPTDLVVILDRSGSMEGQKLEHARAAIRELVARLGAEDRFALVTYSNDASLTVPLTAATDRARDAWLGTVGEIRADGGTNISSGLDLALDTLERARTSGRAPRAILISDGLANQGDPTPEGLLHRAGRAARGDYVLSTVGVGADFNEYLMTALADAGTGSYYYLQASQDLARVFAREFDAARTTVASSLAVRIDPADGVRVLDAAGYPLEQDGGAVVFRPGSLFAGQERRVWVTLAVPNGRVGEHDLGRFSLVYRDTHEQRTLAFGEVPRVACVQGEDDFYSKVDVSSWTRAVVVDGYNKMQEKVAREVKAGRRDEAMRALREFRAETEAANVRLKSAPVSQQLSVVDKLEADVSAAFEGADQIGRQNELSKQRSAAALDARRAGGKK
jgi:Ca-activated chloride channel family protein